MLRSYVIGFAEICLITFIFQNKIEAHKVDTVITVVSRNKIRNMLYQ